MFKRLGYTSVCLLLQLIVAAQNTQLITGEYANHTVAHVLNAWSEQWSLSFAYDSYELSQYKGTWRFVNATPDDALHALLQETPFAYNRVDDTYVIFPVSDISTQVQPTSSNRSVLSGILTDRLTGERLPFGGVALLASGLSAVADEFGQFSLVIDTAIDADTLVVAYVGYQPFKQAVQWQSQAICIQVKLAPISTFLKDVVIRADSIQVPEVTIRPLYAQLNPNAFQIRYGLGEADVFRVAQILPGVSGSQEYSNGLYIRGSNSDQSQMLLDGFNIYHQDHFFGMISAVNAYAVKSMRLHKGPADVTVGGRASGLLELTGKEGDLRNPSGQLELGALSLSGAVEAPLDSSGKASIFIAGRRSITDAIQAPAYKELFNTIYSSSVVYAKDERLNAFEGDFKPSLLFQDVNAKLTFRPNERAYLNLSMYASRDDLEFIYADTTSNEALNVSDIRYSDETAKVNRGIGLRWNQQINSTTETFTSIGFSKFSGSYFSSDSVRNNLFLIDSTQFSFRSMSLKDLSIRHYWQMSGTKHIAKLGLASNSIYLANAYRSFNVAQPESTQAASILTLFAGDDWHLSKRWSMHYGARFNYYTATSRIYAEPRWSMQWMVMPGRLQLRSSAGRACQFIQRRGNQNLYQNTPDIWVLGSETIPVLLSDQLSLGGLVYSGNWSCDVEVYRKWNHGQLVNPTNMPTPQMAWGNSNALGMDMMVQFNCKSHRAILAYSWLKAVSDYQPWLSGRIVESYYRNHEVKLNYEWKLKSWSISIVQLAASGTPYTSLLGAYMLALPGNNKQVLPVMGDVNTSRTDWYLRTDVLAGYNWCWGAHRLAVNVGVYNVFDCQNYRGMQYSVQRNSSTISDYTIQQRKILMIGRLPSIHLSWQF
jgi:ferric enterobactin receptor